jgi:hypothetical protein
MLRIEEGREVEMICAICGQKIEPAFDEPGEWRHTAQADLKWCLDLGCLGEAVAKEDEVNHEEG